jgi:hypothetical protein
MLGCFLPELLTSYKNAFERIEFVVSLPRQDDNCQFTVEVLCIFCLLAKFTENPQFFATKMDYFVYIIFQWYIQNTIIAFQDMIFKLNVTIWCILFMKVVTRKFCPFNPFEKRTGIRYVFYLTGLEVSILARSSSCPLHPKNY